MRQDIRDLTIAPCDVLALGEPTHQEPAFGWVRNELFVQLAERGFRSIALETDRVAALIVNDFVQEGIGSLDTVMSEGFSHGFGDLETNRRLIAWMRDHNQNRPPEECLAFHGFDAPLENAGAPSPRRYLEHARDYLRLDLDLAGLLGDDERWSRTEAVMDPAMSIGATPEAERLRLIADDMLTLLYAHAPERTAAASHAEWLRAKTHLTAGLGLLRYHKQAAQHLDLSARLSRLLAVRDALMAQNLLDIRSDEGRRGATLVFAHNLHLQRNQSSWHQADMDVTWSGAGTIVGSMLGEQYTFVAGSLGRSEAIGLRDPEPDTYEGFLQSRTSTWGLTTGTTVAPARTRTDTTPRQGYIPLDRTTLDRADAVLHISDGTAVLTPSQDGLRLAALREQ
ncbi:erythromycin esterase family protein [Streptomyces sp. A3M-1-3]|uniref:erythromycin esterase family protein n=1 Tax=Streptomyces sp. A3M-1-3 TaxID=2962044 RepID=UPI0020B895A1|nr:erythromycin esterase family protein [Streptomyces sp. A3M-1-3]MCP3820206.1 erythromycin esterase family protein [Streptomyces sp. A3M-1-3]